MAPELVLEQLGQPTSTDLVISSLEMPDLLVRLGLCRLGAFDFDGTLTGKQQYATQWNRLDIHLLPELQQAAMDDREQYLLRKKDDDHHPEAGEDWWVAHIPKENLPCTEAAWLSRSIERYARSGMTQAMVNAAGRERILRPGTSNLLALFEKRIIISFGIEQFIRACLQTNGLTADIAANRFRFDEQSRLIGYHTNVVASLSKKTALERYMTIQGFKPHEVFAIGDAVTDIEMMQPDGFNVLLMPKNDHDAKWVAFRRNHLPTLWPKITMILVSDTLNTMVELINMARRR